MQKARRHLQQKAPTACRRTVSGSISTSCSECFSPFPHGTGSLSVSREYSALPDGPGRFRRDCTCPALLRIPLQSGKAARKGLSPAAAARSSAFRSPSRTDVAVLQPHRRRNACGLGFSPFARRYWGNHCCFLFLRVLRCFSSPRWPPAKAGCHPFRMTGCPIRKSADQRLHAPPRGFSQLAASFVASGSQGIRRAPLTTFLRPRICGGYFARTCVRSSLSRLSHHVIELLCVENNGFEPLTPCLQSRRSSRLS